jgi:lipoprotein-anchoring transpeptidase ErfK/SrfK
VRRAPAARASQIARLHFLTEDGQAEVYAVLAGKVVGDKQWLRVSVPKRPRAVTGWVPAAALGKLRQARTRLVVNRAALVATLYGAGGKRVWTARVGVGRPSLPTPVGHFYVREKLRAIGSPVYGPFALGTSAYSAVSDWPGGGVVGIHGTNEPNLIPGRPSHGCIRLRNPDITRLWRLISVGTPIDIT